MVAVTITYQGELRCEAEHGPSGTRLTTDAPKDNHGKGESFSPTDLVAAALGACKLTIMGITARKLGMNLNGAHVQVEKEMIAAPIRRIGKLTVHLHFPMAIAAEYRVALEQAALACPVHKSLHPDIAMPVEFHWAK